MTELDAKLREAAELAITAGIDAYEFRTLCRISYVETCVVTAGGSRVKAAQIAGVTRGSIFRVRRELRASDKDGTLTAKPATTDSSHTEQPLSPVAESQ